MLSLLDSKRGRASTELRLGGGALTVKGKFWLVRVVWDGSSTSEALGGDSSGVPWVP